LVNISYFRHTFVADHFQYLADIGPIALVAGIVAHFTDSENWELPWLAPVVGSILMLALALVSWNRAWAFQDETTLWTDTLEKNPGAWEAHNYFGEKYLEAGQLDDAMGEIEATLKIFPFSSEAHNNLGNVLAAEGNLDGGIAEFQKAIAIFPGYAAAISNLGNALLRKGEYQQAQDEYRKALALKSDNPGVINNLGMALYDEGHLPEAEQSYRRALALNPNLPYAHGNLGVVLAQQGRVAEARAEFHRALEIYPGDQRARAGLAALDGTPVKNPAVDEASRHDQLGTDLARKGSMEEAMAEFQKSLQLNPHDAEAHNFIGILLAQSGKLDLAIAEFKEALRIAPDYPGARENLAHAQSQLAGQKQQDAQP
jgi:Flp pilus assembly protein TadD